MPRKQNIVERKHSKVPFAIWGTQRTCMCDRKVTEHQRQDTIPLKHGGDSIILWGDCRGRNTVQS